MKKGGYLVAVYAELVKDMWIGTDSSVAPWDFKKVIGRFAPQVFLKAGKTSIKNIIN